MLRSTDGQDWKEIRRFNFVPDDRDPQILVMPNRMILYAPSMDGGKLTTFAVTTEDGENFSQPRTVYEPQFIFWKPLAVPDGYGDCSYPEAVQAGQEMLVSYYSSHEGTTNIYLACVPLAK